MQISEIRWQRYKVNREIRVLSGADINWLQLPLRSILEFQF